MEMTNGIQIGSLINKNRQEEPALCAKLDWLRLRCLLETEASVTDCVASYDNADSLLEGFLFAYLKDDEGIKSEHQIIQILEQKYNSKEFEDEFYEFLSDFDQKEETINQSWKKYPEVFINNLKNYRTMGTMDQNISNQLMDYAKKINNDPLRYIYELIQNADDCEYNNVSDEEPIEVKIVIKKNSLEITYPEDGMTYSDIIAITTIGQSNKRKKKKKRIIGEKGRGFKTIFSVCDFAEIHSGPFYFKLSQDSFAPEWIEPGSEVDGTKMILHFKQENNENKEGERVFHDGWELFSAVKERYGFNGCNKDNEANIMKNCPIIFTNKIGSLVIQYDDDDEILSMMKQTNLTDSGKWKNGNITVEYSIKKNETLTESTKLECYWYEKEVEFTYEEYISHYKDVFKDEAEFYSAEKEVITYPIVLIAPMCENNDAIKEWKGNMFTYLPTFTNINAPISIQAPFELNEDRSCMWINGLKGDEHSESDFEIDNKKNKFYTTKWNRRLFSELFIDQENNYGLIKYAYEQMIELNNTPLYDYIPAYKNNNHTFFLTQDNKYAECVEKFNSFCKENEKNIIFENFKTLKFLKCLDNKRIFCCNDEPLFFDDAIDDILLSMDGNGCCYLINDCLSDSTDNRNSNNTEQKSIPIIKSFNGYENILALGAKKAELSDEVKIKFANTLLEHAYDKTVKELVKDTCSDFLPKTGSRKELKAIKMESDLMAPGDPRLCWLLLPNQDCFEGNRKRWNGEFLKIIPSNSGVKDDNNNDITICDIYGKDFTNCVNGKNWEDVWKYVYSKNGNSESVNCSFELYKELMCFFGNTDDWYEYSDKCLKTKNGECTTDGKKECVIPADNLRKIWELKYKEYRGE